jgi:hypothetical protein
VVRLAANDFFLRLLLAESSLLYAGVANNAWHRVRVEALTAAKQS